MTLVAEVAPLTERATPQSIAVRPVSVLHLVLNLRIGGLERLLVDILKHTDRSRVAARVLCIEEEGELAAEVRTLGIPADALRFPIKFNPKLSWTLARYCRRHNIDVLHSHGPYAHLYGALARLQHPRLRVVSTRHGYLWPTNWKRRMQNRLASRLSQRIVAVSEDLARDLVGNERLPDHKCQVIYNGIDPDRFATAPRTQGDTTPVATMVARLSTEKDVPTLLRAAAILAKSLPDFELRIIGDGPERAGLEHLAKQLGADRVVRFLGARMDVAEQLQKSRLFVLSTNTEGLSISILEAMASGLPVVATAVGGNPEVIIDGQTGFLVPRCSPDALAERMLQVLTNDDLRQQLGNAGHSRVKEVFHIRRTAAAYESLYQDVCEGRPACSPELQFA